MHLYLKFVVNYLFLSTKQYFSQKHLKLDFYIKLILNKFNFVFIFVKSITKSRRYFILFYTLYFH